MDKTHEELSLKRLMLSRDYSQSMKELGEIKQRKAVAVLSLLPNCKSQKEAELRYSVTEDGQREIYLTYYTKGIIEEMRATKTQIEILNAQAYNQY